MKLTKRTFKTKDSAGCEFECVAFIASEYGKKIDSECRYTAMGIECTTLKELQDKIAKLLEQIVTNTNQGDQNETRQN